MQEAELTILKYIYKHQGQPKDIKALVKKLPPEVDYSLIERSLIMEHLLIFSNDVWLLTPKGRLYVETLLAFRHNKFYLALCLVFCLSVVTLLIFRIVL